MYTTPEEDSVGRAGKNNPKKSSDLRPAIITISARSTGLKEAIPGAK